MHYNAEARDVRILKFYVFVHVDKPEKNEDSYKYFFLKCFRCSRYRETSNNYIFYDNILFFILYNMCATCECNIKYYYSSYMRVFCYSYYNFI